MRFTSTALTVASLLWAAPALAQDNVDPAPGPEIELFQINPDTGAGVGTPGADALPPPGVSTEHNFEQNFPPESSGPTPEDNTTIILIPSDPGDGSQ